EDESVDCDGQHEAGVFGPEAEVILLAVASREGLFIKIADFFKDIGTDCETEAVYQRYERCDPAVRRLPDEVGKRVDADLRRKRVDRRLVLRTLNEGNRLRAGGIGKWPDDTDARYRCEDLLDLDLPSRRDNGVAIEQRADVGRTPI